MSQVFFTVMNMSVNAGFVALVVILARLFLSKSPRIFSYVLWAAVVFRMLSPFAFESVVGFLFPSPLFGQISGVLVVTYVSPSASASADVGFSAGFDIFAYVWLLGIAVMLGYALVSYVKIRRRVFAAVLVRENIYESDRINSPFVIGFLRPRIVIPTNLSADEADYIIRHESTHLRRGDHFVKLLAFLGLALHWFNPLMWLSYFLMTKDMELSCDESVMRRAKNDIRVGYSGSLLSMCVRQSGLPNPLQFGGSGVKSRIKNVLGFKKCSRFVTALSAVFAVMIVGVCVFNAASVDYAIQLNETEQVVWEIVEEIGEMSFVDSPVKTFYVTMSSHQSGFITTFTISARQR